MQILSDTNHASKTQRGVALGFFDGVHHGHMELLRTLTYHCVQKKLTPTVFTFANHPLTLLAKGPGFSGYLVDRQTRLEKIAACGIEETYLVPFDRAIADLSPQDFLQKYLRETLHASLIVVGDDYRFGKDQAGDVSDLQRFAKREGIDVIVVDPMTLGGKKVASSAIRDAVDRGDMELARLRLDHPYAISGTVISGRKLGQKIGFPTANMTLPADRVCPAFGVYATRTFVGDRSYDSVTNVGVRPTVAADDEVPLIETYLFDASLDLYDQTIEVEFLHRLRPEARFSSLLRLGNQIRQDLDEARRWHQNSEVLCRRAVVGDIPLHWLPTRRFAQSAFLLAFRSPAEKKMTTSLALLIRILTACCRSHPTRPEMASALDYLFGARLQANLEKQGDMQTVLFTVTSLASWTDESSPFGEAVDLMLDTLVDPLLDDDGLFDAAIVESERKNLMLEWLSRENDRTKYAYDRCLQELYGDHPHGISSLGDRDLLPRISREDLKEAHAYLLEGMQVAAFGAGTHDPQILERCMMAMQRLPKTTRPVYHPGAHPTPPPLSKPIQVREEKDLAQARIVLAYEGMPPYFSLKSVTAHLMNNMLGGDVYSLLFDVVREKMGLAYHVFSLGHRYLSLVLMIAGVAPDKVKDAQEAMHEQLAQLVAGDFPDNLLWRAKQMTRAAIEATGDDLGRLLGHQLGLMTHGRTVSVSDHLSLLDRIEKQDIQAMAQQLKPAAEYLLTAVEKEEEA